MIEFKNVTKYFYKKNKKIYIFKNVSLQIPSNVNIAILGASGSGKSTLLRMIGKIMSPNHGTIESHVSFSWPLGSYSWLASSLTGTENIKFACKIYGYNQSKTQEIIALVQDFSELATSLSKPVSSYTAEMKRRLSYSLNITFNFDYTLADERLTYGNKEFRKKSLAMIYKKLESSNLIFVSNYLPRVREVCDVGIVINQGQLYYYNDINDAILAYQNINKKVD